MIVFFTYFYTAIAFNPKDVADNMKKQGGFIPGIRPGKQTSDFIDNILTKITLARLYLSGYHCYTSGFCMSLGSIGTVRTVFWRNKFTNYCWCSFRYFAAD